MTIPEWSHLFPSRTQKLSTPGPKIAMPAIVNRGRCRFEKDIREGIFFCISLSPPSASLLPLRRPILLRSKHPFRRKNPSSICRSPASICLIMVQSLWAFTSAVPMTPSKASAFMYCLNISKTTDSSFRDSALCFDESVGFYLGFEVFFLILFSFSRIP